MRTNKACPLYTGSMGGGNSSPPESEVEPPPMDPDDDELGYVDGTKLILPPKIIKVIIYNRYKQLLTTGMLNFVLLVLSRMLHTITVQPFFPLR